MKRPSFQFYPGDWRKDAALQSCSLAARGAWIELMCIMHNCEPYGVLSTNGTPFTVVQIARLMGESPGLTAKLLAELEGAGVFSRQEDGSIYSRRMVHDGMISDIRSRSGKMGGNPKLLKQKPSKTQAKDQQTVEQSPTPSSSSSSSKQKHESTIVDSSPSACADGPQTRSDPIPYQAIVDVFNRTLTRLPKARNLTPKRRTLIRSAWQAAPERRSVEFWEALAAEYEADDFTNGTGPYLNGHEGWRPSIDYLLRADVVTRTFERAMDRMERSP